MKMINYSKEFILDKDLYEGCFNRCSDCPLLQNHNCRILVEPRADNAGCSFRRVADAMTEEKALLVLHKHQVWRRGKSNADMISPHILGLALDVAIHSLRHNKQRPLKDFEKEWFKNPGTILTD